jgi:hypothetical protein
MSFRTKQFFFGFLLASALPGLYFLSKDLEFSKEDFTTLSGYLKTDPEFNKGGKNGPYLVLRIEGYENRFNTNDFSYHVLKKEALKNEVKKGDKVYINVKSEKSTSFEDKINRNLNLVRIMELWTDENKYISVENYNEYRKKDFKFSYLFWIGALIYFLYWNIETKRITTKDKKT